MNKSELLEAALKECAADDAIRVAMNYPCTRGEYTYATDGHLLLRLSNELLDGRVYTLPEDDIRYPKVEAVIPNNYKQVAWIDPAMMPEHVGNIYENSPVIKGYMFRGDVYNRLRKVGMMLGVKGWRVETDDKDAGKSHAVVFKAEGGKVTVLVMPVFNDDPATMFDMCISTQNVEIDTGIDLEAGIASYEALLAREAAKAEDERNERKGKIWTFRVAKYANMYVEAKDEAEAKMIAEKYCDDVDDMAFDDSDVEVEGHDRYPDTYYREDFYRHDKIFTLDGEVNVDEYDGFEKELP